MNSIIEVVLLNLLAGLAMPIGAIFFSAQAQVFLKP